MSEDSVSNQIKNIANCINSINTTAVYTIKCLLSMLVQKQADHFYVEDMSFLLSFLKRVTRS